MSFGCELTAFIADDASIILGGHTCPGKDQAALKAGWVVVEEEEWTWLRDEQGQGEEG